ncbi:hypothetical protein KY358_01935 [Candidatus Woesearchaeota archaeon]|nr:hypothetical protein [Candidatus Woesearchaeota archaeon]
MTLSIIKNGDKTMGWEGLKSTISFFLGIIILTLGAVPLMNKLNITSWTIPDIPEIIMISLLIIGGIYVIIDGFLEVPMIPSMGWISILTGLVVSVLGILKLLGKTAQILVLVQGIGINILFAIVGFLLVIGAFMF